MTHKIKIGNRDIKLSEPQKRLLDEMDSLIIHRNIKNKSLFIYFLYENKKWIYKYLDRFRTKTLESLVKKGVLIEQDFSDTHKKIIKSY